jgi:hypothetical protein
MPNEIPSRLISELEPIQSRQPKVVTTCCIEGCQNEFTAILLSPSGLDDLKAGRARIKCPFHSDASKGP